MEKSDKVMTEVSDKKPVLYCDYVDKYKTQRGCGAILDLSKTSFSLLKNGVTIPCDTCKKIAYIKNNAVFSVFKPPGSYYEPYAVGLSHCGSY